MFRKTKGGGKVADGEVPDEQADSTNPSLGNGATIPSNDSPDRDETLIYSAPTVDTLGDEESLSRLYHSPRGQLSPLPNQKPPSNPNSKISQVDNSIPPNTTPLMREDSVMMPSLSGSRPTIAMSFSQDSGGSRSKKPNRIRRHRNLIQQQRDQEFERQQLRQQQLSKLKRRRMANSSKKVPKEFQSEEDKMSVTIRHIPVAERTAFDKKLPPYLGFGNSNNSSPLSLPSGLAKKVSPSLQHWSVLQQLSSIKHVRQLAFSNSVGVDIFWNEQDEEEEEHDTEEIPEGNSKRKKQRRDGRYRSIDPVKATAEALPKAPPLLSNKKHRLPMRTDVGFPNANTEEITRKQAEIRCETEWEEASPRLVVLVTGDDLGTAVQEEDERTNNQGREPKGLPGMPWAGKNLIQAKERNNRHFSRSQDTQSNKKERDTEINMLAPPLDAMYSKTLGWRPRPFHDRPPGLRYTLVCPMSVHFSVGKLEPLVCSMALYSLQKGKISEEFYFPAGDWDGKLQLDAIQERFQAQPDNDPNVEEETDLLMKLWNKRKQKAIFAHNSWAFGENDEDNKLYIVLQVYKVTHPDSVIAYWAKGGMNNNGAYNKKADKKTWKRRLQKQFATTKKQKSRSDGEMEADESDVEKAFLRSSTIFDAYGTQFTSPLCFGITSLFPEDSEPTSRHNSWPRGQVQQSMDLYLSPGYSESQDDFLERLRQIVANPKASIMSDLSTTFSEDASESAMEDEMALSMSRSADSADSTFLTPSGKKKRSLPRLRAPKRVSKKDANDPLAKIIEDTPLIPGSVTLFTSNLDVDFLQSMLTIPPELIDKVSIKTSSKEPKEMVLPRILVDASGDSAIMVDPKKTMASAKRSDLVRLPSTRLAEHLDSSEFREVLFLSPEPEKIFESSDPKSLLNLLYIYPKLLKFKPKEGENTRQEEKHNKYTIRVRLVRNISSTTQDGIIENHNEVVTSFHNAAPWGGLNLLQSVFTHIPRDGSDTGSKGRQQKVDDQKVDDPVKGIPLRDEFKMKLPTILDGTYFLQFSLFAVEFDEYADDFGGDESIDSNNSGDDDCGINLSPIAEKSIPLSSSFRDANSGVKATTIIPNGCHRLKLGNFQFQIETKVVSSVHVSDPVVATALREFPIASIDGQLGNGNSEIFDEMAISSRLSTVGRSVTSHDTKTVKIPYPKLLSLASRSALVCHFQSLFFLHLQNLTKSGSDVETSGKFVVDNMQSLLVLFQRVKSSFLSSGREFDKRRLCVFMKATIDSFDEISYNSQENEDDLASELPASDAIQESVTEIEVVQEEDYEEIYDGGAIRKRTSDIGLRLTKTYSTMETVPELRFSRVAYGASKNDRMRLEAELGGDVGRISTLFDDDETVASLLTLKSAKNPDVQQLVEKNSYSFDEKNLSRSESLPDEKKEGESNDNGVVASPSFLTGPDKAKDSNDIDMAAFQQSISELQIGQRVKSAAQVMLAPCVTVTPGLAAFLCKTSPRNSSVNIEITDSKEFVNSNSLRTGTKGSGLDPVEEEDTSQQIIQPGSDLDEDETMTENGEVTPYCTTQGIFRGAREFFVQLEFSIKQYGYINGRRAPLARGSYVYESIMALWLQAWSDYITNSAGSNVAINFLGKGQEENPFTMFYLQMDVLLPMLLKSIALRYGRASKSSKKKSTRCILDKDHVYVFESFIEMLAIGLMGQAMTELQESTDHGTLSDAMNACDTIVDFIIGLLAIVHPAHMESLISKFVLTLRKCESGNEGPQRMFSSRWNEATVHRAKCSRQLRLRIVEKLAVLPNFVALNFPQRYSTKHFSSKINKSTWTTQCETSEPSREDQKPKANQDDGLLPKTGWLASLLANESLSICALSCEAVVTEAIASIESQTSKNDKTPLRGTRSVQPSLTRSDLLMFQSIAIHAISCVYELLLRRHAMDRRFQKESSRGRVAALFTKTIFEKSLASVRWLARMESTHRVRSIWFLCFVYILQESPENLIRSHIRSYCDPSDLKIHRFIRLLRLGSSTFQSFVDQQRHCMFPLEIDRGISPWLLQESFNTVCATIILVVDESAIPTSSIPKEQRKMIQGILDLLLHVLTTPQSTVTHLRAIGGAIHAFDKFGTQFFLETTGVHLQHWVRVIIGLMNSTALSVRSIAVDFVVSILCGVFDLHGNIEDVALLFATVLPEVVAREIALCSVNGLLKSFEDVEKSIWPLRRSLADIEDANPLDDDRVDPQLSPMLSVFCRAAQAIIDGVLVEMRLRRGNCVVVGTRIPIESKDKFVFDADEESLFEAANFFTPETSPMQRLRWLLTLKSLHEANERWLEAAETLILCARTISDAIPHLGNIWRPTRFSLWSDSRRSLWLSTVGEEIGNPEQGNAQVMTFANSFLEPENLFTTDEKAIHLKLPRPTLSQMSWLLTSVTKEAVTMYEREGGMDASAYAQLESLLMIVMGVLDEHEFSSLRVRKVGLNAVLERKQYVEQITCLRKVIAGITADMTKLAEKLLLVVQDNETSSLASKTSGTGKNGPYYVRLFLSGKKPSRFQESTSLPTFLEWDKPCICRVPKRVIDEAIKSETNESVLSETAICKAYGTLIQTALMQDPSATDVVFSTGTTEPEEKKEDTTYVNIDIVRAEGFHGSSTAMQDGFDRDNRRFVYSKPLNQIQGVATSFVQMTVAISFPCPLSRQRSMLTNEVTSD